MAWPVAWRNISHWFIILRAFEPSEQGRASGFFGMGVVLAPAIGPSIGGLLVDGFGWRSIFNMVVAGWYGSSQNLGTLEEQLKGDPTNAALQQQVNQVRTTTTVADLGKLAGAGGALLVGGHADRHDHGQQCGGEQLFEPQQPESVTPLPENPHIPD